MVCEILTSCAANANAAVIRRRINNRDNGSSKVGNRFIAESETTWQLKDDAAKVRVTVSDNEGERAGDGTEQTRADLWWCGLRDKIRPKVVDEGEEGEIDDDCEEDCDDDDGDDDDDDKGKLSLNENDDLTGCGAAHKEDDADNVWLASVAETLSEDSGSFDDDKDGEDDASSDSDVGAGAELSIDSSWSSEELGSDEISCGDERFTGRDEWFGDVFEDDDEDDDDNEEENEVSDDVDAGRGVGSEANTFIERMNEENEVRNEPNGRTLESDGGRRRLARNVDDFSEEDESSGT